AGRAAAARGALGESDARPVSLRTPGRGASRVSAVATPPERGVGRGSLAPIGGPGGSGSPAEGGARMGAALLTPWRSPRRSGETSRAGTQRSPAPPPLRARGGGLTTLREPDCRARARRELA